MDNTNISAAQARAREGNTSGLPIRALTFSGVIFALSLMVYAGLSFGYKTYLNAGIDVLDGQIAELDKQAPADEKEKGFISFYSQVVNMQKLLESHVAMTPVLDFLEQRTLPDVAMSGTRMMSYDHTMTFSGAAKTFDKLAEQLALYDIADESLKIGLTSSRYAEGVVKFEAKAVFNSDIFLFSKNLTVAPDTTTTTITEPIIRP
ncbi:MAG: hypothetical protein PHG66_02435 [Candidatus Colwellbacteria bacterium]|nr:hypothetical protein [Candidatus Colwellbacteria bacterium]